MDKKWKEGQSAGLISVSKFLLKGKSRRKKRKRKNFCRKGQRDCRKYEASEIQTISK